MPYCGVAVFVVKIVAGLLGAGGTANALAGIVLLF